MLGAARNQTRHSGGTASASWFGRRAAAGIGAGVIGGVAVISIDAGRLPAMVRVAERATWEIRRAPQGVIYERCTTGSAFP